MELQSEERSIPSVVHDSCDESKCVSIGAVKDPYSPGPFSCYGDNDNFYPMACADGFLPVIVDNEPPILVGNEDVVAMRYFTCCPPSNFSQSSSTINATRHCSDPITSALNVTVSEDDTNGEVVNDTCNNFGTQKHVRQMKTQVYQQFRAGPFIEMDSFLCCDISIPTIEIDNNIDVIILNGNRNNTTSIATNFLDQVECVPYRSEFYESGMVWNQVGKIRAIFCDFPEGDFHFSRPLGDFASTRQYQCCKSGTGMPPFVQDSAFKITVYIILAIWCLTLVVSGITIIALLAPLLKQMKKKNYHGAASKMKWTLKSASSQRRGGREMRYSSYNLYVVNLSILDSFTAILEIALFGSAINQKLDPGLYSSFVTLSNGIDLVYAESVFGFPYVIGNMLINAIIVYQIHDLLKSSKDGRRIRQPSLTRVNIQMGVVYLFMVIYAFFIHFQRSSGNKAVRNTDFEKARFAFTIHAMLQTLLIMLLLIYIIYVTFLIWWHGYMPSSDGASSKQKSLRELSFFFYRIVAVFLAVWLPVVLIANFAAGSIKHWSILVQYCFVSMQPVLTFCMVLTKYDARKYILDLVTLSYLFGKGEKTKPKYFGTSSTGVIDSTERTQSVLPNQNQYIKALDSSTKNQTQSFVTSCVNDDNDDANDDVNDDDNDADNVNDDNIMADFDNESDASNDDNHSSNSDFYYADDDDDVNAYNDAVNKRTDVYKAEQVHHNGPMTVLVTGERVPVRTAAKLLGAAGV